MKESKKELSPSKAEYAGIEHSAATISGHSLQLCSDSNFEILEFRNFESETLPSSIPALSISHQFPYSTGAVIARILTEGTMNVRPKSLAC